VPTSRDAGADRCRDGGVEADPVEEAWNRDAAVRPSGAARSNAPPPPLAGYYAMEARNFADGTRSILEIRNALAAEFGPVAVDDVVRFFRDAEKAGTFTVTERVEEAKKGKRRK
jgi:hypothetical protein